ncbi:MAG: SRPBCC family protein [Alphaproteobacteria bacterium]|nr:SRPBCC family protein [Alphaproteobacteria bacterium]
MHELTVREPSLLQRVAGATAPVDRRLYALTGFGLMGLKYAGECAASLALTGQLLSPEVFFSPSLTMRLAAFEGVGDAALVAMGIWTLPFIWIGASMSVRRARDAGLPGFFGLLFFVPLLNMLMMLGLAALPSRPSEPRAVGPLEGEERVTWAAISGVAAGSAIALAMVGLSVFGLGEYGGTLFVGSPFVMGAVSAFLLNLRGPRSWLANIGVGTATVFITGGLLLLFALEGVICLAMAAPLAWIMAMMGVVVGKMLAGLEGRRYAALPALGLPLLFFVEPPPASGELHEAVSVIDIDAPPEVVWDAVIGFGGVELPPPPEWFFQAGIAYPVRARIEGEGVGAVRYCEFSTGPFVEPITAWEAPHRLSFDVTESPPTMHEWSVYETVHAPHLDGVLKSRRGEFRLTALPGGGTRLEGHTWYTFDMAPAAWWSLWSQASIHAIHLRVLEHIKGVAEGALKPR